MVQDRLTKAVLRRLKELDLPACLLEVEEFRDKFFFSGWLMMVRHGDKVANVHLIQPSPGTGPRQKSSSTKVPTATKKRFRRQV